MLVRNGEAPPTPQNDKEKAFFEAQGVVFLDDEFENALMNAFFKCAESGEYGLKINVDLAREYAKFYEFDFLGFYEILSAIVAPVNKTRYEKLQQER